jgi:predicted DNA-binding mobile mystery protein A
MTAKAEKNKMNTDDWKDVMGADELKELAAFLKLLGREDELPELSLRIGAEAKLQSAASVEQSKPTTTGPAATKPVGKRGQRSWLQPEETQRLRAELDEIGVAFRLCKRGVHRPEGWMRAVRQAVGIPVIELARRMGVAKSQVFRFEESEQQGRIRMDSLRSVAEAMGCELVYALVPREGKFASMIAIRRAEEEASHEREAERRKMRARKPRKSSVVAPRGETLRQECERLGIADAIYGRKR